MRISLLVSLLFVSLDLLCQSTPEAKNGVLDAREWNFSEGKIALNGYWQFYKNEFIAPDDSTEKIASYPIFPEIWDPSVQFGTYKLKVILPPDTTRLAIELPQIYCSYELWVNGEKIAENGKIGTTKEKSVPQWLPQVGTISVRSDSLSLVLYISNFYHFKGGSKEPIFLGVADALHRQHEVAVRSSMIESTGLIILAASFFLIYYLREERKKITLYFSLLCLSWALRSEFSNVYAFISYFPDFDWATMIRIEYITLFLTMIWSILFLSRLFPNESNKIIKHILVTLNCIFIALAIVTSAVFFTQWLDIYLIVAGILLAFCGILVIRAWINERSGARYVVACVFLSIALFGYDIFVYQGFFQYYNALLFSIGYLLIFLMMGISLLYHLKVFKGDGSSSVLTYEDLYGTNK